MIRTPRGHAYLAPLVVNAFEQLDVSVALLESGTWAEIVERPTARSLLTFELAHGRSAERFAYNRECCERASGTGHSVLGSHGGFCDFFVPIPCAGQEALLVSGPFATEPPARDKLSEGWRALTGRRANLADPGFSDYVACVVSMLTLAGHAVAKYKALLEGFAELMAGRGPSERSFSEIEALRAELAGARMVERTWAVVREMIDARTTAAWASRHRGTRLWPLGLSLFPRRLAVVLFEARDRDRNPLGDLLDRDALQRAFVWVCRKAGNVVSGQVGNRGVVLLGHATGRGSSERDRDKLVELVEQARVLARRKFGMDLHLGVGRGGDELPRQYHDALAQARDAVSGGRRHEGPYERPRGSWAETLRELGLPAGECPEVLIDRFDRYLDDAPSRVDYRLDLARIDLEAGFERAAASLVGASGLSAERFQSFSRDLEERAAAAPTFRDLLALYRAALLEILSFASDRTTAEHDRSLRRADDLIAHRCFGPISLRAVAKEAGFAPAYFARLFKRKHGVTFKQYVVRARIERARQLLASTSLESQAHRRVVGVLLGPSPGRHVPTSHRRDAGTAAHARRAHVREPVERERRSEAARGLTPRALTRVPARSAEIDHRSATGLRRVSVNSARSAGAIRMAFSTRMCANSFRSQSR